MTIDFLSKDPFGTGRVLVVSRIRLVYTAGGPLNRALDQALTKYSSNS